MFRNVARWLVCIVGISVFCLLSQSCQNSNTENRKSLKKMEVKIDWIPSPEYYGFFYAKAKGLYKNAGLDVKILRGTGAPAVAKELSVGTIYAGTTTSDNVLREMIDAKSNNNGEPFYSATALLSFNPCVIASLDKDGKRVENIKALQGKTLGVNKQSSVYQQFQWLITKYADVKPDSIMEYPIGWGGSVELELGKVDAILAYATNVVLDLEKKGIPTYELYLGDEGACTYGTVLVTSRAEVFKKEGLSTNDIQKFVQATKDGYVKGASDIDSAIEALLKEEPTLNREKLRLAINKIAEKNDSVHYNEEDVDRWYKGEPGKDVSEEVRVNTRQLYKRIQLK